MSDEPERFGARRASTPGTSALATGALISAFPFGPLGIVLGLIAKAQIRKTGQAGDRLATAAIVIGVISTLSFVVFSS